MKVTISDVARLAGVSTATVSHTINNTRYVSSETKEKVYSAIAELGYTPDASARSFRTGKKKIIGFIVPDIANKFFATMIEAVEDYLSAHGYQLIIANTREDMDREETNIRLLTAGLAAEWSCGELTLEEVNEGGWADPEFLGLTYEESKTSDLTPRMEVDWIRYWINENYTTDGAGGVNPNGKFF